MFKANKSEIDNNTANNGYDQFVDFEQNIEESSLENARVSQSSVDSDGLYVIDEQQPLPLPAEIETTLSNQENKSSWVLGAIQPQAFYDAIHTESEMMLEAEFQQSGLNGFLPFSDPGVCQFMSIDFARAIKLGLYQQWKYQLVDSEAQDKARLIQYFRDGQYLGHCWGFEKKVSHRDFGPHSLDQNFEFQLRVNKGALTETAQSIINSIDEAKSVELNLSFSRTAGSPHLQIDNPLFLIRFGHAMIFTASYDDEGNIDENHILFMDPNAGIVKIAKNEATLTKFLDILDQQMYSQFQIRSACVKTLSFDENYLTDFDSQPIDHRLYLSYYRFQRLCDLDNYLFDEINRLQKKSSINIWNPVAHESKIQTLSNIKERLNNEIMKTSSKSQNLSQQDCVDIAVKYEKELECLPILRQPSGLGFFSKPSSQSGLEKLLKSQRFYDDQVIVEDSELLPSISNG